MDYKDMEYRSIPRIANSDLSEFKSLYLFGKPLQIPPKAKRFGTCFHQRLLEPNKPLLVEDMEGVDLDLVDRLVEKVKQDKFCKNFLTNAEREKVILFDEPTSGAECKAKIDLIRGKTILDIKTTSDRNYAAFVDETITSYDYDRQAAFYVDGAKAKRFVFIGVQKVAPYELFFFEITHAKQYMDYGRKKYRTLLRAYVQHYNQLVKQVG